MGYIILLDGKQVETASTPEEAQAKADQVQRNAAQYLEDDETGGALAVVGFAPASDPDRITYIKPRDSVPDALVPDEFRQFR